MPFARSADRPPRTKRVSLSTRRNAVMTEGEPIDLRVMFGEQTRYQCPPCAVYFPCLLYTSDAADDTASV